MRLLARSLSPYIVIERHPMLADSAHIPSGCSVEIDMSLVGGAITITGSRPSQKKVSVLLRLLFNDP